MTRLVIYCADVGSVKTNFGWARVDASGKEESRTGTGTGDLVVELTDDLNAGRPVALGFECPLWVPLPRDSDELGKARPGECEDGNNRPWSGGPGAAVLTTGVAQVPWVLGRLKGQTPDQRAFLSWKEFVDAAGGLFLWEAFVTANAKGKTDEDDARIGARAFRDALPNPESANAFEPDGGVISLVGAATLRAGWHTDTALLAQPCLVIKA